MDIRTLPEAIEMDSELREHPGYGVELEGTEIPLGEWAELRSTGLGD